MDARAADRTSDPGEEPAARPNLIETAIRRVDKFQQAHTVLGFPWAVVQKFGNDQAGSKAALLAYYGLFAVFPLLLLFTTILGYVLQGNERLRQNLVDSAIGTFPIIGAQLQSQTHTLEGSGAAAAIGAILLLYGAVGLGQAAQGAMNAVWNIPYVRRPSFVLRLSAPSVCWCSWRCRRSDQPCSRASPPWPPRDGRPRSSCSSDRSS